MHRLQISLTEEHYEFLKAESFTSGKSMAAVLRDLLDEIIATRRQEFLTNDPIWNVIGIAAEVEGPTDISLHIDEYLYGEKLEPVVSAQFQKVAEAADEYLAD